MPWDHINKVINRSLPLRQPSKAASSHSSICTNSRQRSPGLRKPHLLPSCFYLSIHCISRQDCRSEKPEISLYLRDCQILSKERSSGGAQQPLRSGVGPCGEENILSAWLGTQGCFSPVVQTNACEGGSWGTDCFSTYFKQTGIPASQPQDTWRT